MRAMYLRFPGGKAKALTFSYDDGVEQDVRLVEILRKYGMRGTFNINSGLFSPEGTVHPNGKVHRRMTQAQVLEAYPPDVCEVACHASHHPHLTMCNSAVVCNEVLEDRKALEAMFDRPIHGMAYPFGPTNDMVVDACRLCGIYYSRTVVSTEKFDMPTDWLRLSATCHHKNPRLMELADRFLAMNATKAPQMFYVWGHAYEFEENDNWNVIEDFCEKMAGKEDIWYATNMEIYTAWADYMRLETSADGSMIFNPNCRSVWIANNKNQVFEIKPGQTIIA